MKLWHRLRQLAMPPRIRRLVRLNDLITGYWISQAIYVAAKLRIPDHLMTASMTAAELAAQVDAQPDALYRLLRALESIGLLREQTSGRFALTDLGRQLRSGRSGSVRAWAQYNGEAWHWNAWGDLLQSVKTGKPALDRVTGSPIFNFLGSDPEAAATFDAAMADLATISNVALVSSYRFGHASTIVDVGGGDGALLMSILSSHPKARGVLFDRLGIAESARKRAGDAGLAERCTIVEGDFFQAIPTGGDLYMIKQVLHDWDDARAGVILQNCATAMSPSARLIIIEIVVPAETGPSLAKLTDLEMLVMTGGRERTASEYQKLLKVAGLRLERIHTTRTPFSIIECAKA